MNRTLPALVLGAALGAAATLYVASDRRSATPPAATPATQSPSPARGARRNVPSGLVAAATASTRERSSLYSLAADADTARIEELLAATASQSAAAARNFAIGVYLRRYVEIDPQRAIESARRLGVARSELAELYAAWAAADSDAALDALRAISDPAETRAFGLAMLAALGNDEIALARVASAVAPEHATVLRIASVELLAQASPEAALDVVLELPDLIRWPALERVAVIWARSDVRAALARAEAIPGERLRQTLQFAILTEWLRHDADAMLAHLADVDDTVRQQFMSSRGLQEFARADPRRALETVRGFPDGTLMPVEQIALRMLATENPLAALEYADSVTSFDRHRHLLRIVATGYGRNDPDAALAWARAAESTGPMRVPGYNSLVVQVLAGIGLQDPNRAIDIALTLTSDSERVQALRMVTSNAVSAPGARSADVAQHVLAIQDPRLRQMVVNSVFESWSRRAPREALDWLLANGSGVQSGAFEPLAQQLGRTDPTLAASYTSRIPSEARAPWVRGVALGYAQTDPTAALDWVAQFRGEPAYDAGIAVIVPVLAQQDPRRAADLLGSLTSVAAQDERAVMSVAAAWAASEPARAAEWTLDLKAGRTRDLALTQVVQQWGANDAPNARNWALSLPPGAARDAALTGIVTATSSVDSPEQALWNAFSDGRVRERAVVRTIAPIGMRDPNEARALMERYVSDPDARRQAEQMLEAAKNGGRMRPMGTSSSLIGIR